MNRSNNKPTLFDKLKLISKNGYLPFVFKFAKVTILHLITEVLLTVYLLELYVYMTNFYLKDAIIEMKASSMLLVTIPLIIAAPIAFIFGIACILHFTNTVHAFYNDYSATREPPPGKKQMLV